MADLANEDCDDLHARAEMLHHEAHHAREKARERGPEWDGYVDQIKIVDRVEKMAVGVEEKIDKAC